MKTLTKTFSIIIVSVALAFIVLMFYTIIGDKQDLLVYSSNESAELYFDGYHVGNGVVCIPQLRGRYVIGTDDLSVTLRILDNSITVIQGQEHKENGDVEQFPIKFINGNTDLYFAPVNCADWTFGGDYQYIIE